MIVIGLFVIINYCKIMAIENNQYLPAACEACYKRQQAAQPDVEPSCILDNTLAPLGEGVTAQNQEAKAATFGQVMIWAVGSNCPEILKARLGHQTYEKIRPGRPFRLFNNRTNYPKTQHGAYINEELFRRRSPRRD